MTLLERVASKKKETTTQRSLVDQAASSVKWSILYNVVPRFVTPFSTMILAALLTPADFGLVAIATLINALSKILVDMGLGKAVIHQQTDVEDAASVSFWLNTLMSVVLYGLLWLTAPWISLAYHNDKVTSVIRVAAIFLLLGGLSTIPKALLRRNMEFQQLFWVNSSFLIVQAVASVILALCRLGYWAIIYGELIGMLTSTVIVWSTVHWRPKFVIRFSAMRSMLNFSKWIMIAGLQNWMFLYADNAIAGLFLGVQGLGTYSLGFNIAILVPAFAAASIGDVAYPTFCKLQESPDEIGRNLITLQKFLGALLFPLALGLAALAPSIIKLLYGNRWQDLGSVIGLLILMPGLGYIWSLNEHAYQAVGRPDIWIRISTLSLFALCPILWIAAPHGLLVFTLARFGCGLLLPLGNLVFGARILGVEMRDQIKAVSTPFLFSLIIFLVAFLLIRQWSPIDGVWGWFKLCSIAAIAGIVYFLLLWRMDRKLWDKLFWGLRRMLA
jgi:PST family polysaccharide transporter